MHFTIAQVINLLSTYGYFILFPIVIVEGPVITILAGYLVSLGIFNLFVTYIVVVIADLTGDVLYYWAGRLWLQSYVKKRFDKLEKAFKKHKGKILFFNKVGGPFGPSVMVVAGAVGIPFGKFMYITFLISLFKSLMFILIGYYLGGAVNSLGKDLNWITSIGLFVLAAALLGLYIAITKIAAKHLGKLQQS